METLAESATGGIVMAPRLRTQLSAPQESAHWIRDELPGNPRPRSMTNSVAVLDETLPHHCAVEFSAPAGKFYNGRSQQLLIIEGTFSNNLCVLNPTVCPDRATILMSRCLHNPYAGLTFSPSC